jgi:hypothetical protein
MLMLSHSEMLLSSEDAVGAGHSFRSKTNPPCVVLLRFTRIFPAMDSKTVAADNSSSSPTYKCAAVGPLVVVLFAMPQALQPFLQFFLKSTPGAAPGWERGANSMIPRTLSPISGSFIVRCATASLLRASFTTEKVQRNHKALRFRKTL